MIYVLKSESDFTKYEREYNYYDQKKQQEGMRAPNISVQYDDSKDTIINL